MKAVTFPDLEPLFSPRSVVVVGASARERSIGRIALDNIARHSEFDGDLHLVNPGRSEIDGRPCHPSVDALPAGGIDVALVVVAAPLVLDALEACAARGVRFAIVITSGFAEMGEVGRAAEARMREIAHSSGMRIYGPNCPGLTNVNRGIGLNISPVFKSDRKTGPIGLVTQGGGLGRAVMQGADRGCGIGLWASAGNEVDLDFADLAHHMLGEPSIAVVAAIVEGFRSGERLMAVARAAEAAGKPIVLLKIGRSEAGITAAQSHTASMAGSDAINDAVFRSCGIIRVDDIDELHETAALLARCRSQRLDSAAVVSFSGGAAVFAADILGAQNIALTRFAPDTMSALEALAPDFITVGNPLDLTTDIFVRPDLHRQCLEAVLADPGTDAIVVPIPADYAGTTLGLARDLVAVAARTDKLIVPVWMSERRGSGYDELEAGGLPPFRSMTRAASALGRVATYLTRRRAGLSSPPTAPIAVAPPDGTDEVAAKAWLKAIGVPIPREDHVRDPDEAARAAAQIGGPVALKVVSRDIAHKSDVGGVELNLRGSEAVSAACARILGRVRAARPEARIEGVLVSEMAGEGIEMVVGIHRDAVFGPILTLGFGGTLVEILGDVVHLPLPATEADIREALGRLRAARLLGGVRGRPAADVPALVAAATRLGEAAWATREAVAEVEINPLIVRPLGQGVVAVDALIRLRNAEEVEA